MLKVKLCIAVLLTALPLIAQTWSVPERVSPYTTNYYIITGHGLTTDSSGTPWCGWSAHTLDPSASNIYISHYCDDAWSDPDTILPLGGFFSCNLASDANGNVWVVAEDGSSISACFYNGIAWSNLMQVPTQGTCCHRPVAAGDTLGNLWTCWAGGGPGDGHHIWGNTYAQGQWGSPVLISYPGSPDPEEFPYSMTTDKQGRVWVDWWWFVGFDMRICASFNNGNTWSDTMIIAEYSYWAYGPALTVDIAGRLWAGWTHADSGNTNHGISASYYDGDVWSRPMLVNELGGEVAITSDDKGIVWLTWENPDGIYYSYWNGDAWSPPAPVDTDPADDSWPRMTFDGERIWVTWYSFRDGSPGIFASYTYGLGVEDNPTTNPKPLPLLHQNYPNPFSDKTEIKFQIRDVVVSSQKSVVSIEIYDVTGQSVKRFNHLTVQPFNHITWDGTDNNGHAVPSGIYVCRLSVGQFTATKKMLLIH